MGIVAVYGTDEIVGGGKQRYELQIMWVEIIKHYGYLESGYELQIMQVKIIKQYGYLDLL